MSSVDQLEMSMTLLQQVNNWVCQATLCLRQGLIHPPLPNRCSSPSTTVPLPITHTPWVYLYTILWFHDTIEVASTDSIVCDNFICLWAQYIVQRTHAKQCKDLLFLYTHIHVQHVYTRVSLLTVSPLQYPTTKCTSAQFPTVLPLAAPQPAPLQHGPTWQH